MWEKIEFTPEDKYFYLYLFTNPHTNLSGCYEISMKQIINETGYSLDTIENLIHRFEDFHKVISYSRPTKEILLLNWHKYNWTKSDKFLKSLEKEIQKVKNPEFRSYLWSVLRGDDTVSIPYGYRMDSLWIQLLLLLYLLLYMLFILFYIKKDSF